MHLSTRTWLALVATTPLIIAPGFEVDSLRTPLLALWVLAGAIVMASLGAAPRALDGLICRAVIVCLLTIPPILGRWMSQEGTRLWINIQCGLCLGVLSRGLGPWPILQTMRLLVWVWGISPFYGILQAFRWDPLGLGGPSWAYKATGLVGNTNYSTSFSALIAVTALALVLTDHSRFWKGVGVGGVLMAVAHIILGGGRAGLGAAFLGCAVTAAIRGHLTRRQILRLSPLLLGLGMMAVLFPPTSLKTRFRAAALHSSFQEREAIWRSSLESLAEHAWSGVGCDNVRVALAQRRDQERFGTAVNEYAEVADAHNGLLDFALIFGIPAALAYVVFIAHFARQLWRTACLPAQAWATGIGVAWTIAAMFHSVETQAALVVGLFLPLGIAMQNAIEPPVRPLVWRSRFLLVTCSVATAFFVLPPLLRGVLSEEAYVRAQGEANDNRRVEYLERAVRIDPTHRKAEFDLGQAYMLQGQSVSAIERFQNILRHHPFHVACMVNIAWCLQSGGGTRSLKEAEAWLLKALDQMKGYAKAHVLLGTLRMRIGKREEAIASFERYLKICPSDESIRALLTHLSPARSSR